MKEAQNPQLRVDRLERERLAAEAAQRAAEDAAMSGGRQ